ncbi:MAG: LytTR family transcriptional regulator DNA-binding domain-containing protein [Bacteroidales bacterium]|nr:LytTR family transcriptional regulator DNA-binding domain-containing protein [Bacteroidales bacterium]
MTNKKYLYINSRDELYRVDIASIAYFEADGNYTHFMLCNQQRGTVCMNLLQMQRLLTESLGQQASIFARVGKSYIVNLTYVYHIHTVKQMLVLSDGVNFTHRINLSKAALVQLKQLFVKK